MHKFADIGMAVILLAGITVMVRPKSQGPKLVTASTNGFANIIQKATAF
jgi:hypothetical protein